MEMNCSYGHGYKLVLPFPTWFIPQHRGFISECLPHPQPLRYNPKVTRPAHWPCYSPRSTRWPVTGIPTRAYLLTLEGLRVWGPCLPREEEEDRVARGPCGLGNQSLAGPTSRGRHGLCTRPAVLQQTPSPAVNQQNG